VVTSARIASQPLAAWPRWFERPACVVPRVRNFFPHAARLFSKRPVRRIRRLVFQTLFRPPKTGRCCMSDTEIISLVRLARSGDREAFGALVAEFEPMVAGVVMRRLRHAAEASEVTQDVFIRALQKLDQLREPERFVGWLKRIAIRLSINRAVRRPQEAVTGPDFFAGCSSAPVVPIDGLLRSERARQVRSGLDQLRRMDRETLLAFYFEGQSLKEMSDRFASPIGTIKRRLHTARNRLKEALGEYQSA
jgi:RNA polymerase sigma-70 factor (ECF subfamily)